MPEWKPRTTPATSGFHLTTLKDLLSEPEERVSFTVAKKLPKGGFSALTAKPKVGKSTFARNLALAVAKGEPFLDCETTQGPVIYFALEEKRSEVARHFRDLGATGDEPIFIYAATAPQDAIAQLHPLIKDIKPVLGVIDPLFKFVRVRDGSRLCRSRGSTRASPCARPPNRHTRLGHTPQRQRRQA